MDCSPSGSFVHGILQARILGWFAISFSWGSSWTRDWTWVSCIAFLIRSISFFLKLCYLTASSMAPKPREWRRCWCPTQIPVPTYGECGLLVALWQASSPEDLSQAKAVLLQELGTYMHLPLQQTFAKAGWMKWEYKRLPSFLEGKPTLSCNWRSRTPHGISLSLAFGWNYILGPHFLLLTSLVTSWEHTINKSCAIKLSQAPLLAPTKIALWLKQSESGEGILFFIKGPGWRVGPG